MTQEELDTFIEKLVFERYGNVLINDRPCTIVLNKYELGAFLLIFSTGKPSVDEWVGRLRDLPQAFIKNSIVVDKIVWTNKY